ncbi:MAG: DUF2103 domain-containing protein [Candidatus Caenarcaniphilales bacterium]|nr:DUF2103 domain-containing protein [Candidatus Caenarcaniphilales bacterium]
MKYRARGAGKIKYEHGMIKDLRTFLEGLKDLAQIQSMIPGEIKPVKKAVSKITIRRLTPTPTGLKAIFQSGAAVQEVFFVGKLNELNVILEPFVTKE